MVLAFNLEVQLLDLSHYLKCWMPGGCFTYTNLTEILYCSVCVLRSTFFNISHAYQITIAYIDVLIHITNTLGQM